MALSVMETMRYFFDNSQDKIDATDGYMEDISKALATTASIFNYTYPSGSANDIIEEHSIISQKITKLENDQVNHELYTIIS